MTEVSGLALIRALLDAASDKPAPVATVIRSEASELAAQLQPGVHHPNHQGRGVVIGVTRDGLLEVTFAEPEQWAVALPADQVTESLW